MANHPRNINLKLSVLAPAPLNVANGFEGNRSQNKISNSTLKGAAPTNLCKPNRHNFKLILRGLDGHRCLTRPRAAKRMEDNNSASCAPLWLSLFFCSAGGPVQDTQRRYWLGTGYTNTKMRNRPVRPRHPLLSIRGADSELGRGPVAALQTTQRNTGWARLGGDEAEK